MMFDAQWEQPMSVSRLIASSVILCLAAASGCTSGQRTPESASARVPAVTTEPAPLELVVLGSGGPGAVGRAATCFVLLEDGTPRILIDAGPGSFARLGEAHVSLDHLDIVLLTHLHIDHTGELPGIFLARAVDTGRPINFRIFGPTAAGQFPATSRFINLLFGKQGAWEYLPDFSAPMTFTTTDVDAHVRPGAEPQTILEQDGLRIAAIAGHHYDCPAVIYRVDYKGRSVVFTGDIDPAGLPNLRRIADHCDLLVFNTVVLDPPGSRPILYFLHTPPHKIGQIAAAAHAGALLLTHLNPSIDEARDQVLASIRSSFDGPITFSVDGMRVNP
jgi:ribonuclease BN (tRNA processing enzyme)